jgi:hypothetical protein
MAAALGIALEAGGAQAWAEPGPRDLPEVLAVWPPAVVAGSDCRVTILLSDYPRGWHAKQLGPCTVMAMLEDSLLAEVEVAAGGASRVRWARAAGAAAAAMMIMLVDDAR